MLTIGDFATLGRVSVRMLRHYDSLGLLPPAAVDPHSGYRYYTAAQLGRLNRVIALKDLGLTLAQVRAILDETVDLGELRGMLRLRRAQLAAQLAADTARLSSVEARLHMIETEGRMTNQDVVLKQVPPIRVAELSAVARSYEPADIGPVLTPLYPELFRRLEEAGVNPVGPSVAWYDQAADGESVVVHAGVGIESGTATGGVAVVELPAITAATTIHHGPMDTADRSMQVLARWIEENDWRPDGYAREFYVEYWPEEADKGVTELQLPVRRA
ncbi:MerR family transcriptional regulator [Verrucosispora sp. WMMA2044]|uniref:MerR family transcriptional regulator n=1 Tax=Verrucosispora sioxanthis TaxID=2499994 RepID=A0A6M1L3N2_9ACTN|nr:MULTISPECIES: MerR family transcriptional regulator [Micromonospora]NEE64327.1 MerR family transcriptional regulator [Verrucosispora sioxanthis]NGM13437.1 MerR family transcriptional regulator [Verrucosispora sioxanthis]WBB51419.1 MerR family transcriptional regulator [Verrucosispora sp. WMMA2044]